MAVKRGVTKRSERETQLKKKKLADDAFDWSGGAAGDVVLSDSDDDEANKKGGSHGDNASSSEEEDETEMRESAQEKRVRLAKEYLEKITEQEAEDDDDVEKTGVEERVGARLRVDALESMGRLFKEIASKYDEFEFSAESTRFLKGHKVRC